MARDLAIVTAKQAFTEANANHDENAQFLEVQAVVHERDRRAVLKNRVDDPLMMELGNMQKVLNLQDYTVEGLVDHTMGFMDEGDEASTF